MPAHFAAAWTRQPGEVATLAPPSPHVSTYARAYTLTVILFDSVSCV
jgi:hypothetical protein